MTIKKKALYIVSSLIITVLALSYFFRDKLFQAQAHRLVVKNYLNDPESAQFRKDYQSKIDKTVWCGEFNAKNRIGGMVGFTKYIVYLEDSDKPESVLNEIFIEKEASVDDINKEMSEAAVFRKKWNTFCQ